MRVIVSDDAEADIEDIADYIAQDSPRNARKYATSLRRKIRSLGRFPRIHPLRNDVLPGMRVAVHGNYLILYAVGAKAVDVVRVVHGAMDLAGVAKP